MPFSFFSQYYYAPLLLTMSILLGAIFALMNGSKPNAYMDKFAAWFDSAKGRNKHKEHWFNRFIKQPILWSFTAVFQLVNLIRHEGLRSGVILTCFLLMACSWLLLLAALLFFAVQLAIIVIIFRVVQDLGDTDLDHVGSSKPAWKRKQVLGITEKNERVNPKTGEIEKEGFFGYSSTDERIDPKTGKYQKKGIFGWEDSGTKIDQKTGNIQKEGFFGYQNTAKRINPKSGVIEEDDLFGWTETEYRINQETGKKQKKGLFGWTDV